MSTALETVVHRKNTYRRRPHRHRQVQRRPTRRHLQLTRLGQARHQPEQLFALGYSACFIGAIQVAAGKMNQIAGRHIGGRRGGSG